MTDKAGITGFFFDSDYEIFGVKCHIFWLSIVNIVKGYPETKAKGVKMQKRITKKRRWNIYWIAKCGDMYE